MSKNKPLITLQEVNDSLLQKLYDLIAETDEVETVVALSGAVAKLNVSAKGSNFFVEPESAEEILNNTQLEAFEGLEGGVVVDS